MTLIDIAKRTNLLRGTVEYRLRRLRYDTGRDVQYPLTVIKEVVEFNLSAEAKKKTDYSLDSEVFYYWKDNKENSIRDISKALNLSENRVHYILDRIIKSGFVHFESKLNYTPIEKL